MNILLAVDLQKDFIDGTLTVPGAAGVLPAINAVKNQFDRVYFTLDWHPVNHCSFKAQGGPWPVHCVHHTAGASIPDNMLEGQGQIFVTPMEELIEKNITKRRTDK